MGQASMRKWERRAVDAMVREARELPVRERALALRAEHRVLLANRGLLFGVKATTFAGLDVGVITLAGAPHA